MNSFRKINLYCLLFLATTYVQVIYCQRLNSTLIEGDRACPGAQVNFTCMTNGSLVLAWRSDEYIGTNGAQLEFTSANGVGNMIRSLISPDTFATLVRINGTRVVESVLTITASGSIPTATVTCSEVGQGATTITFTLLAIPGTPQNVTANRIDLSSDDCVILLQWMPPSVAKSSVNHYIIDSPAGRFTTRDTSVVITLLIHHCNITTSIRISAIDYCGRGGPNTNDTLGQLLIGLSDSTTRPATGKPNQRSDISPIVGGILGSLLFIGFLILIALSIILVVIQRKLGCFGERDWEYHGLTDTSTNNQKQPSKRVDSDSASGEDNPQQDRESKEILKKSKLEKKEYIVVKSELFKKNIGERRTSTTVLPKAVPPASSSEGITEQSNV